MLLTSGRTLAFGAAFFIPVVLARVLTVEQFGTYKQLFLLFATLYYSVQLGIATSLFYFLPKDPGRAGRYLGNSLVVLAAAGGLSAALLAAQPQALAWLLNNASLGAYAPPLAIYLLLMLVSAPLEIAMICGGRYRAAAWTYALSDLLRAGLLIAAALATGKLIWLMLGAVAFAFVRALAMLAYFRRRFGSELRPDPVLARAQLAYSLPFGLAVLVGTLQAHLHEYVVSHAFDAATFAIYAVGCLQIPLVDFIATPTGDVMMVKMAEKLREAKKEEARATWHDGVASLALLLFPLVGLLLLVAPELIVLLFTGAYAESVPIFRLWATTILLVPLLTEGVLRVYARTRFLLVLNALQLVVILAFIRPLLARFGLPGAVLVTLAAMVLARALALASIRRLLGVGLARLLPWKALARTGLAAAIALLLGLAVKALASLPPVPALLLAASVHCAVFAALAWRWGILPALPWPRWQRWLRRWAPRSVAPEAAASKAEAG